jgi:hypothetical protein
LDVSAGITVTAGGVQVIGHSTSDLARSNPNLTTAFGLAPHAGGLADVRIGRDRTGEPNAIHLVLTDLGLSWDGRRPRPTIVETYGPTAGRSVLNASGSLVAETLPSPTNIAFYDVASLGAAATQSHYANNRYFPRSTSSRCPATLRPCPVVETDGLVAQRGDWRTGGTTPDRIDASRLHEDGDVHAGAANSSGTPLPGGTGLGAPFPGSKGYRSARLLALSQSSLLAWVSQDTVLIFEWGASPEHNTVRRGLVASGTTTDPSTLPNSGIANYAGGVVFGWYVANGTEEPRSFVGEAAATLDFTSGRLTLSVTRVVDESTGASLPLEFSTSGALPRSGDEGLVRSAVFAGALNGGIATRLFGPVGGLPHSAGSAEIGATFSITDPSTGATALGGFLARRR